MKKILFESFLVDLQLRVAIDDIAYMMELFR